MLTVEELTAALNDPASPMREKLLQHLERSPLDPAQAYQQLMQESGVEQGGLPPQSQGQQTSMAGLLDSAEPMQLPPMLPQPYMDASAQPQGPVPGLQQPSPGGLLPQAPAPDLSREANPAGVVNLDNSAEVMPNLMPGETGGMPNVGSMAKMLEGLAGGMGGEDDWKPTPPPGAVAPRGNNWNTFQAAQFQTPGVQRMPTLAEILGRGR